MPFDGLFRRHFRREDNSSKTNMTEWQKACTARAEKYGYSKVPAAVVYTAFAETYCSIELRGALDKTPKT